MLPQRLPCMHACTAQWSIDTSFTRVIVKTVDSCCSVLAKGYKYGLNKFSHKRLWRHELNLRLTSYAAGR